MLTDAQKATLKAHILATPEAAAFYAQGDLGQLANYYNVLASPAFIVWKTNVNPDEIMRNGMDWTRVDNLSIGKARIWDWLTKLGAFDASRVNVRAGIDATWVGTAADLAVRAQVYTHCKRQATVLEKLFATGTGSDAVPATLVVEGAIYYLAFSEL